MCLCLCVLHLEATTNRWICAQCANYSQRQRQAFQLLINIAGPPSPSPSTRGPKQQQQPVSLCVCVYECVCLCVCVGKCLWCLPLVICFSQRSRALKFALAFLVSCQMRCWLTWRRTAAAAAAAVDVGSGVALAQCFGYFLVVYTHAHTHTHPRKVPLKNFLWFSFIFSRNDCVCPVKKGA